MSKRSKKGHKTPTNLEGYVVVAFAEDISQAQEYKVLLDTNDIPAIISEKEEKTIGSYLQQK